MRLFISVLLFIFVAGCSSKTITVHDRTTGIQIEILEDQLDKFLILSNRHIVITEDDLITDDGIM